MSILGPVSVADGSGPVEVRGELGRSLVARLALAAPHAVSEAEIAAALWEEPPDNPERTIRPLVSRLRSRAGRDVIARDQAGFRLGSEVVVDSVRVGATARRAASAAPTSELLDDVTQALELWRGTALMDVAASPFFIGARYSLETLRQELQDRRCELLLELGDPATAVIELAQVARAAPHREPTHILLMRALHATGDSRGAMRVGSGFRARWSELGQSVSPAFDEFDRSFVVALDDTADALDAEADPRTGYSASPPARTGGLLGRARELDAVMALLGGRPVTTLIGPGGIGKTRLAVEAATVHPTFTAHIVMLADVDLDRDADAGDAALAVADAIHLESIGDDPLGAVANWIGSRSCIVLLDNCEHLVDPLAALVWELTRRCSHARFLATSRTPLGLPNESVYRVPPLGTRDGARDSPPSAAAELLAARSGRAGFELDLDTRGDRDLAEEICALLDGLPLAIELAAARLPVLGLDGMRTYIRRGRVDVLNDDDLDGRHSSIRATVEWSRDMVGPDAASLLPRLVVFPGWFHADQVERVTGFGSPVELLSELVAASFVELQPGASRSRYRMLEPIRQTLVQDLDPAELENLRDRHARWAFEYIANLYGRAIGHELGQAQRMIDEHVADLVDALAWSSRAGCGAREAVDGAAMMLGPLLLETPRPRLFATVADVVGDSVDGRIATAWQLLHTGGHERAIDIANPVLDDLPSGDDRVVLAAFPVLLSCLMTGQFDRIYELVDRHLAPTAPPHFVGAAGVAAAAFARSTAGEIEPAVRLFDEYRELLDVCRTGGFVDFVRAEIVMHTDLERSRFHSRRGLEAALEDRSSTGITRARLQQLVIELVAQDPTQAARVAIDHMPDLIATGNVATAWIGLRTVAQILLDVGDVEGATELSSRAHADPRNPAFPPVDADALARPDSDERYADLWEVWSDVEPSLTEIARRSSDLRAS